MNLGDLYQTVCDLVDDQPDESAVIRWMQNGQNRLASSVGAVFPPFFVNEQYDSTVVPVFDEKWHEALVVFACARYKEGESSLQEVNNFQQQFEDIRKDFSRFYQIPPQYRDDDHSQQFTGTAGQTTFTINKPGYDYRYSNLQVYINNTLQTDIQNPDDNTFTLGTSIPPVLATDVVTALWENVNQFEEAPYPWMSW